MKISIPPSLTAPLPRIRIAPTPSGYLHFGNLFSFALTWLWAQQEGAQLLLRIDDQDRQRCRPEYVEDIFRSLEALEIQPDLGPSDLEDFERNWSQKHRRYLYQSFLNQLAEQELIYACQCSRKEIQALASDGRYPGTCRHRKLPLDQEQVAWRLITAQKTLRFREKGRWQEALSPPTAMNDLVVRKKDGHAAYQVSSLVDDLHYGISHIMRGEDLYDSTLAQLYLADLKQAQSFLQVNFHHHPLWQKNGQKLSKSQDAPAAQLYLGERQKRQLLFDALAQQLGLEGHFDHLGQLAQAMSEQGVRI